MPVYFLVWVILTTGRRVDTNRGSHSFSAFDHRGGSIGGHANLQKPVDGYLVIFELILVEQR